jgi:hypothetical protein
MEWMQLPRKEIPGVPDPVPPTKSPPAIFPLRAPTPA